MDETIVLRVVVPDAVEILLCPATIAALEEAQYQMSYTMPTVAQMLDYFELNYLVVKHGVGQAPVNRETKSLISLSGGLNMRLLHGSVYFFVCL